MTEHQHLSNIQYLRLSLLWQADLGWNAREECWQALTAWCDQHGAYLGGKPTNAIILHKGSLTRFRSQLARWLSLCQGIASFELSPDLPSAQAKRSRTPELGDDAPSNGPQDVVAMIEALANYQQNLLEEFQWTVSMLPRLQRFFGNPYGKARVPNVARPVS